MLGLNSFNCKIRGLGKEAFISKAIGCNYFVKGIFNTYYNI